MYTGMELHRGTSHTHLTLVHTRPPHTLHPYAGSWNNNRLALLGDEVLDVIVLHEAMRSAPAAEGSKTDKSGKCCLLEFTSPPNYSK